MAQPVKYTRDHVAKYFKKGDPITLNAKTGDWVGSDTDVVYVSRDGAIVSVSWKAITEEIPELAKQRAALADEFLKFLALGWRLIDRAALKDDYWDITEPVLMELRTSKYNTGRCFNYGRFYKSSYPTEFTWVPERAASALPGHADCYFIKRAIEDDGQNASLSMGRDTVVQVFCHVAEGVQLPDYFKGVDAHMAALRSLLGEAFNEQEWHVRLCENGRIDVRKNPGGTARAQLVQAEDDVPYRITTQPDGFLPDMTEFTLMRAGSTDNGWYSTSSIKAGRDLVVGETLVACRVNRLDGELTRLEYTAQKGKLAAAEWPKAFASHIAKNGTSLLAGNWTGDGKFAFDTSAMRLWSQANYRAFTTAPFANNLVQALACNDDFTLHAGQTLCLQVRDLKTQHLHEQHFFTAQAAQAGKAWSKALCEQLNTDSQLLRAGVLHATCDVVPAATGNAFWVPQCAELSVTLTVVDWWKSRKVEGSQALPANTALHAWVYDAFSHRLLGHHEWAPSSEQRASGKWLAAWANALNTSAVAAYLRAGVAHPTAEDAPVKDATELGLWHRGDALRIFTSLPDADNQVAGPALELPVGETSGKVEVTLRHPFSAKALHRAVFVPPKGDGAVDQHAWRKALVDFLREQAWPELQVQGGTATSLGQLWLPRFCELQLELDAVAEDDEAEQATDTPGTSLNVSVIGSCGSLQLTVESLAGDLEFRLTQAAWGKGYRVAACVPTESGEDVEWPVSVTADRIVWGGPIAKCTYEITLDHPGAERGNAEETIGHVGAYDETHFWHAPTEVKYTPAAVLAPYTPSGLLCEDYGSTEQSEIFDTLGQTETGVDPRTGLFHAHYPVVTLQGLQGLGPLCDLTLHYSAVRGNEAGLGDGWAWRFSSLDVRDRRLTLADGVRITFSATEWERLGKAQPLKKNGCLVRSNRDYSEFTIDLPSGRREILSKPGAEGSDEVELNDDVRQKIIAALSAIKEKSKPKFPSTPDHWSQWILVGISPQGYQTSAQMDFMEASNAWEKYADVSELDERIAYYKRPFVQLLPSRIESALGESLDLKWKRQQGQFLLMGITSGDETLFTAEYLTPDAPQAQVNMQVWPQSDEGYQVKLQLKHLLLRTIQRVQAGLCIQQVDCEYTDDPTLDRVLCRLQELDGSVECVRYNPGVRLEKERPLWPRVVLHALIPGDGQENHLSTFRYTGRLLKTDDSLFMVAGERGAHGAREHYLHVFGQDEQGQRQEFLVGAASADSQWLEFKACKEGLTQVIRYTGYGDDLIKALDQLKAINKDKTSELVNKQQWVRHQQAMVEVVVRYGLNHLSKLTAAIRKLLQVCPAWRRHVLGQAVDMQITEQDDENLPVKLITEGQHTFYRAYYPTHGGNNPVTADCLNDLGGLWGVPQLSCPALFDAAQRPLMAEYQCDEFGNPLGLKLFGYRMVARGGRMVLEAAEQLVFEDIGVKGTFNGQFSKDTPWIQAREGQVVWRQRSKTISQVIAKATPSGTSKVKEWTVTEKQQTHLGTDTFELENTQAYEDNPNARGIVVRTSATTQAGSQLISKELYSRHSQRCLERVEQDIETHWVHDAAGRVIEELRYQLAPGQKGKSKGQAAQTHICTQYSVDGKAAIHRHANQDKHRTYYDGLQRVWRSEWLPAGGNGYVPLFECCREGLGDEEAAWQCEWDYLPGGQALVERAQVQALEGRQSWVTEQGAEFEDALGEPESPKAADKGEVQSTQISYRGYAGASEEDAEFFLLL